MRARTLLTAVLLTSTVIGACGDDDSSSSNKTSEYSVASSLRQIPASATGDGAGTLIMSGDVDKATELAGMERPSSTDADEYIPWIQAITGVTARGKVSDVMLMPVDAMRLERSAQVDEIGDELGWTMFDVHTYAGVDAPPAHFATMTGDFDADKIDAAQGDRVDDIWSLGGEDFETNLKDITAARPLGQSLRTALKDGRLAESVSTPPIEAWLNGQDTLADDDSLVAVAKALDDEDVYSAAILPDPSGSDLSDRRPASAADDDAAALAPFDVFAVGSAHDGNGAQAILVYHCDDEDGAKQNADALRTLFEDGTSIQSRQPFSDMFDVDDIEVHGDIVVVKLDVLDGRSPGVVLQAIFVREPFTVSP